MGVFHGGFSASVYNERDSSPALLFPAASKTKAAGDGAGATQSLAAQGKSVYSQCQACHQASGIGIPGQYPTLVGAEWVIGGEKRLLAILLKGLQGPITIKGEKFVSPNVMPPWDKVLSDKKIAAVASYIRTSWGNNAGEVSEAAVTAARKEFESHASPYTEAELLQIPEDSAAPAAAPAGAPAATSGPDSGNSPPPSVTTPPGTQPPTPQSNSAGAATPQ